LLLKREGIPMASVDLVLENATARLWPRCARELDVADAASRQSLSTREAWSSSIAAVGPGVCSAGYTDVR
jgi:hypothetical protein